jgi:hypothetical protein
MAAVLQTGVIRRLQDAECITNVCQCSPNKPAGGQRSERTTHPLCLAELRLGKHISCASYVDYDCTNTVWPHAVSGDVENLFLLEPRRLFKLEGKTISTPDSWDVRSSSVRYGTSQRPQITRDISVTQLYWGNKDIYVNKVQYG